MNILEDSLEAGLAHPMHGLGPSVKTGTQVCLTLSWQLPGLQDPGHHERKII